MTSALMFKKAPRLPRGVLNIDRTIIDFPLKNS